MDVFLKHCLQLAQPLALVWWLLLLWLGFMFWRRRWRVALAPLIAWLLLSLIACTPFGSWLLMGLEDEHPRLTIAQVPQADAILLLGGGAEPSAVEMTGVHFTRAVNRLPTALLLAAHQKGGTLVLAGGGYRHKGQTLSEADAVHAYLTEVKAVSIPMVSLGLCKDTHDEALKMFALAQERGWRKVLLVTSANHMPRSVSTFTKAGIQVIPVPCNYHSSFSQEVDVDWLHLPQPTGFANFHLWFHEAVGTLVYRWRGWL